MAADDDRLVRLAAAPLEPVARFPAASNATLLVRLTDRDPRPVEELAAEAGGELTVEDLDPEDLAVYKPRAGERPLWDFPAGTLHAREAAAYRCGQALAPGLVPPTVVRDGPHGPGSVQAFVPHDPEQHAIRMLQDGEPALVDRLAEIVALDAASNNADRKAGHVLLDEWDRQVRLIDHGVCFHVEPKLRTVLWGLAGQPVPEALRARIGQARAALDWELGRGLAELLDDDEIDALGQRLQRLRDEGRFPEPAGPHPVPFPPL